MKLFLLTLLLVGVFAKNKDDNVLALGDIGKLKIQQRLSTCNVDLNNRHLLDQVLVNVDRCMHDCKDDFKNNKDVDKYHNCVGNLVDFTLGRVNFLDRNNLLNNNDILNNLVNRLKTCDVVGRGTDFWNTNNNNDNRLDWHTNTNLLNVNRNLGGGVGGGDRDITHSWILNRGTNRYDTNVNRYERDIYGRKFDHGDIYGRGGGDNIFGGRLDRGDIYGRNNVFGRDDIYGGDRNIFGRGGGCGLGGGVRCANWNNDRTFGGDTGVTGWYRVIYGMIGNDQDDDVNNYDNNRYNNYNNDNVNKYGNFRNNRNNYYDNVRNNVNDNYRNYDDNKNNNYDDNRNNYFDNVRNTFNDNYRNKNYDNIRDNIRFGNTGHYGGLNRNDIYGRTGTGGRVGYNVRGFDNDNVDRDVYGRNNNYNLNKLIGDRDIYGRRTDYDNFNVVGGRRIDIEDRNRGVDDVNDRVLYFGIRHDYDRDDVLDK